MRKALRKEPAERYDSVAALAEDVRRHLAGLPVLARPAHWTYRASRFFARHRIATAIGALAASLLLALLLISTWFYVSDAHQERLIRQEQGRADELLVHLVDLYRTADPEASPEASGAARRVLDEAVGRMEHLMTDDPATRSTLLFSAGRAYRRLGLGEQAQPLLEEALELLRELPEPPAEALPEALVELGGILARGQADPARGRALLEEALALERELHGDTHLHVAQVQENLGRAFHDAGDHARSQAAYEEAILIFRSIPVERTAEHADALLGLGDFLAVRNEQDQAIHLIEQGLEIYEELYGDAHPAIARALNGLGMLHYSLGRQEQGLDLLHTALEIHERLYADAPHPDLAMILQNLGALQVHQGDRAGLESLRRAAEEYRGHSPVPATDLGFCLMQLGDGLRDFGETDEAIETYEEAIARFEESAVSAMFQSGAKLSLAALLRERGRSARAIELLEEVLAAYLDQMPEDHPRVASLRETLEEARRD